MAEPLLRLVILGTPGTAGSKSAFPIYQGSGPQRRFTGRVTVTEQDSPVKRNWRRAVIETAHAAITHDPLNGGRLAHPYPLDEALVMAIVFTVAKPASAPKSRRTWPAARPDLLKYTRSTEDALKDAGVLKDDARIVEYTRLAKVYPREDPDALDVPGAVVQLWRMNDVVGWQREAVTTGTDTLFDPQLTEGART